MAAGDVRLEPLAEAHRAALKAACAEDPEIWPIYAISYDPDHFDASFDGPAGAAERAGLRDLLGRAGWSG